MNRPPARVNTSLFVGLWLGLTAMVGICAFVGLYVLLSRDGGAASPQASATPASPAATQLPVTLPTNTPPPVPATADVPTPEGSGGGGSACNFRPEPASGFGYGIQSHIFVGDNDYWLGVVNGKLGFNWVKMQVRWYDIQNGPDTYFWDVLDGAMNEACEKGLRVMLSVVAAPVWTMSNPLPAPQGQEGPDEDIPF